MNTFPRRRSRRAALAASLALVMSAALAACASPAPAASSDGLEEVAMQLSWVKNKSFIGEYFADSQGYYADAGLAVQLVPGPSTGIPELLAGTVDVAISDLFPVAAAIAQEGAPVKILAATFQRNPMTVMSLTDGADIETVQDLVGKRIGVQSVNTAAFEGFLAANGLTTGDVTVVPVEFDPSPLTNGEVDGYIAYATDQSTTLRTQGYEVTDLLFADNGMPFVAGVFVATDEMIATRPEVLSALLEAEIRGWNDAVADPEAGAMLGVDVYGADLELDAAGEVAGATLQTQFVTSDETAANGMLTMSEKLRADTLASLARLGYALKDADVFDLSLLAGVYAAHPDLIVAAKG